MTLRSSDPHGHTVGVSLKTLLWTASRKSPFLLTQIANIVWNTLLHVMKLYEKISWQSKIIPTRRVEAWWEIWYFMRCALEKKRMEKDRWCYKISFILGQKIAQMEKRRFFFLAKRKSFWLPPLSFSYCSLKAQNVCSDWPRLNFKCVRVCVWLHSQALEQRL